MVKKSIYILLMLALLSFLLTGCGNENDTNNGGASSPSVNRLNAEVSYTPSNNNTVNEIRIAEHEVDELNEEEIASFSTKLNGQDSPRSRNIGITSSTLNETIVNPGDTFSFCDTIGVATAEKGYEKADTFDSNGKTIQMYGGGNCQVSSTLYNAVLMVSDLEVKERHPHSKEVHYVEKDKDAAVAHGSVDFKFKNNTGSPIKIYANSDLNSVNIRIVKTNK